MTHRQLAFDLAAAPSYAREDFLVAPSNAQAWTLFENWPDWPDRVVALVGPSGSGKSHLASIWAERAGALTRPAAALTRAETERLLQSGAAVIEDADRVAGTGIETDLFHFLNQARAEQVFVVLTARAAPDVWGLATPDLLSRLRQAPLATLEGPDAALMRVVLAKLFVDRQIVVEASVIDYIAMRLDRSLGAARAFVEALDREALALARRVTRPLAAQVLARLGAAADSGDAADPGAAAADASAG